MKYTVQSGKYIFKNLFYILPFAIIPAIFFSLSTDEEAIECAVQTLFSGELNGIHFSHVFRTISIFNFASWESIVFGLLGMVVIVLCVAVMLALLDKHLRIGKRTYNGLFSKLNDNLISTTSYALLLLVLYEVWSLFTAALLFLFSRISNMVIAYTLICLVYLAMHVLLIYAIGLIYLWLPCMQITGFRTLEALQYSYQLMQPVRWGILVGQSFLLFIAEALIAVCSMFLVDWWTFTIVTSLIYAVLIMVYCVRMMLAYFDRDNIPRADIKKYYQR